MVLVNTFKDYLALCSFNYARLSRICRLLDIDKPIDICIATVDDHVVAQSATSLNYRRVESLKITLIERHKYTSIISLEQVLISNIMHNTDLNSQNYSCNSNRNGTEVVCEAPLILTVKLYHDAKLLELIDPKNRQTLKAKQVYPNKKMYQKDEKWQQNMFLAEWLDFISRNKSF